MRSFRFLVFRGANRLLSPLVPSRNMLPFTYWLSRAAGFIEAELMHLDRFCGCSGVAVDIGANHGLYSFALSKRFERVYAFEINQEVTQCIQQYNSSKIEILHCGLSSAAGTAKLFVPVVRGLALNGWGSLNHGFLAEIPEAEIREKDVVVCRLDDFGITNAGFIKIDVEGHEVEVLKGGAATIRQSRPIVLIEVRDRTFEAVKSWFLDLEYRLCRLEDFLEVQGEKGNYIFVPNERATELGI